MKTNLDKTAIYYILGVPRTGTTIIASVFNSLDDGFCLMEPHWYQRATHNREIDIMETWGRWPYNSTRLIGYKETYRLGHAMCEELIDRHTPLVDFFVVVFRNPVKVLSSQHALGWTEWDHPRFVNAAYRRLEELIQEWPDAAIPVVYEDFVPNPLDYLNDKLPFQIEGELRIRPSRAEFGDPFANRSTTIQMSERETCISEEWIGMLTEATEIWQAYRK
jgi:hypothetical protein